MTRQIRKHILNVRKHKPSKIYSNGGVLGWYKHLDKLERGLKYEILRTQKDARKKKAFVCWGCRTMMERLDITDKKELIAVLAGEMLDALYHGTITAPQDLYVRGTCCTTYTDDGQDRFNALHDLIETTINSYLVDEDMKGAAL